MAFEIDDIVQHKAGGKDMVVKEVNGSKVTCTWDSENGPQSAEYDENDLVTSTLPEGWFDDGLPE